MPEQSTEILEAVADRLINTDNEPFSHGKALPAEIVSTGSKAPLKLEQNALFWPDCNLDEDQETNQQVYETTGFSDREGAERLINQVAKAQPKSQDLWAQNSALSFLNGIAPESPLEGLIAAQMVVAHNMAMEFSKRAMEADLPDAVDRNINRTTKLMKAFAAHVEALNKLRNKGQQQIIVTHQHVQVNQGGQAVIGDVHNPGRG